MSDDLIARLREEPGRNEGPTMEDCREAADALEAQAAVIAEIQSLHREKHGENEHGPYVICDYDKTAWPCKTQAILSRASQGAAEPELIACPHWEPGRITMRKACTACAASVPPFENAEQAITFANESAKADRG